MCNKYSYKGNRTFNSWPCNVDGLGHCYHHHYLGSTPPLASSTIKERNPFRLAAISFISGLRNSGDPFAITLMPSLRCHPLSFNNVHHSVALILVFFLFLISFFFFSHSLLIFLFSCLRTYVQHSCSMSSLRLPSSIRSSVSLY